MTNSGDIRGIGGYDFDLGTRELRAPDGAVVALRPKAAEVFSALAATPGQLVTKDSLMETVWADTFVTDDSLVQCISEIRKALGEEAGRLVTVPRRGYRLEADTTSPQEAERTRSTLVPPDRRGMATLALAVALVAGLVVAAAAWVLGSDGGRPAAEPRTLAVLPFHNDGADEDRFFADGVAEDLVVALSSIGDLRVVSAGTAFAVAGMTRDTREVARLLDADMVLEGRVRRGDGALRLSTSLVEGDSGRVVWGETYEGDIGDIFRFQDDLLDELVRVLSVRLSSAERARLGIRGTEGVAAHEAYLRGRRLENLYTRETNYAAERELRRALRRDPDFALAHAHLAQVMTFRVENRWSETPDTDIAAAFASAERALEIDPDLPFAHFVLGRLYTRSYAHDLIGAHDRAIEEYETAISLDPNYVDAYAYLAMIRIFHGDADAARHLIDEAFERNPVPPFWYHLARGMVSYYLGDYAAAEVSLVRARDQNPTAPFPHRQLIATLGQLGRTEDAEWAAIEYEALGREATVAAIMNSASVSDPAYREKFAEGLRNAGLPEE